MFHTLILLFLFAKSIDSYGQLSSPVPLQEIMLYSPENIRNLISAQAKFNSISPDLITGIVWVESGGNPFAVRYEPRFFERYIGQKRLNGFVPRFVSDDTERNLRATSFGLMQIMGNTAREQGFKREFLTELLDPELNLSIGCHYFSKLLDKADNDTTLALYWWNAGTGREYPGRNQTTTHRKF